MTKPQMLLVLLACLACQAYSAESEAVLDDNMNPVDIVDQISTQPGSPTSLSGGGGWIFGVALTTLGTVVAAVGNLMVTASHRMDKGSARARSLSISAPSKGTGAGERRPSRAGHAGSIVKSHEEFKDDKTREKRGSLSWSWTSPAFIFWSIGNLNITIIGTVLSLASYAYASPALLSPLAGLTIVWNAGLATFPLFGGHRFNWKSVPSTLNVLFGCVLIVLSGPHSDKTYTTTEILALVPTFTCLSVVMMLSATGAYLFRETTSSKKHMRCYASAGLAGLIGGLSNLLAKAAVEAVQEVTSGTEKKPDSKADSTFFAGVTTFILVALAVTVAVSQLRWLNESLERFSPLLVVPIYQASLLSWSTLASGLFFGDLLGLSILQYFGFSIGLGLIVTGVIQLGRTTPSVTSGTGGGTASTGSAPVC